MPSLRYIRPSTGGGTEACSLDVLGDDVSYLVALAVSNFPGMLNLYSRICRHTRSACLQLLFASVRLPIHNGLQEAPPPTIRHLARRLTCYPPALERDDFGWEMNFFPSLRSVRFYADPGYCPVPWTAIKTCITHPNISSISFVCCFPAFIIDTATEATPMLHTALADLSCMPYVWRDVLCRLDRRDVSSEHILEAQSLALLVPPMSRLARQLDLPLETAPLRQMAEHPWSALRILCFCGRFLSLEHMGSLPMMLEDLPNRLPSLTHLTLLTCPLAGTGRAPVLGRLSSRVHHPQLQSLTLAYPDPDDAICSMQAPNLIHLSLRDWPRYYYPIRLPIAYHASMGYPIHSSSECLSILRRMNVSTALERLEVVYEADNSEDDLLRHITCAYPNLRSIELHRYRSEEGTVVPYEKIALQLSSVRWLQSIRLNLDFPETTRPFCDSEEEILRWTALFLQVGTKMMTILHAACPMLVALEMLRQSDTHNDAVWAKFHPTGEPSLYSRELELDGEWPPFAPPLIHWT